MPALQIEDQFADRPAMPYTLYYESHGPADGAPVLLLHGFMEVGRDMLILAQALAVEGFRVITPDLPGYGRSRPPDRSFPPDFYADVQAELQ